MLATHKWLYRSTAITLVGSTMKNTSTHIDYEVKGYISHKEDLFCDRYYIHKHKYVCCTLNECALMV